MKICLIGNSENKVGSFGGQAVKVRLYKSIIETEGFDLNFVDLENFKKNPLHVLILIKRYIKESDRIILITASRGCKYLIPYINHVNKKYHRKFILPMIGSNILHKYIHRMSEEEKKQFFKDEGITKKVFPKKADIRNLKRIDLILPETNLLAKTISNFYKINNVFVLNNFRNMKLVKKNHIRKNNYLSLVFASRVCREKGIFDLIRAVNCLCEKKYNIKLFIFGQKSLSNDDNELFENSFNKNIIYKGIIDNKDILNNISNADIFVFPTKFYSEGTPGIIAEALIAGLPIISSNFANSNELLKNTYSIVYEMNSFEGLINSILFFCANHEKIFEFSKNALIKGNEFTYKYVRNSFLEYVLGIKEKK